MCWCCHSLCKCTPTKHQQFCCGIRYQNRVRECNQSHIFFDFSVCQLLLNNLLIYPFFFPLLLASFLQQSDPVGEFIPTEFTSSSSVALTCNSLQKSVRKYLGICNQHAASQCSNMSPLQIYGHKYLQSCNPPSECALIVKLKTSFDFY